MIKIAQDTVSQNFTVSVSKFETIKETVKVSSQVARILGKHGGVSTSTKNGVVTVELISYDDNVSLDDVLWLLVDTFNVGYGYHDDLGIFVESCISDTVSITTNKDGSTIKVSHKNAHKLKDDDFPFSFAGGLQYFQIFKDTVRIDFPSNHVSALQIAQDLLELLDSLS